MLIKKLVVFDLYIYHILALVIVDLFVGDIRMLSGLDKCRTLYIVREKVYV